MSKKTRIGVKKDYRNVKLSAPLDRGSEEFHSHEAKHPSEVELLGTKDVVCVPRTTTIMGAVKTMAEHGVRRVPVVDAGSRILEGIVLTTHIVDFLGGGDLHNLVKNKYKGNLLAAINEEVREIMDENVPAISVRATFSDALDTMIEEDVGGLPLLNNEGRVVGIITERDVINFVAGKNPKATIHPNTRLPSFEGYLRKLSEKHVKDYMSDEVISMIPEETITEGMKVMISHGFRRIPLIRDGVLVGVVTASDILRYLATGEVFEKLVMGMTHEAFDVPIKTLIRKDVVTIGKMAKLKDAALKMVENQVGCLPVIQKRNLVGIITERDIVSSLVE